MEEMGFSCAKENYLDTIPMKDSLLHKEHFSDTHPIHAIVINLEHRTDRLKSMESQLTKLNIPFSVFSAYYGSKLMDGTQALHPLSTFDRIHGNKKDMNLGALGCWQSHVGVLLDLSTKHDWSKYPLVVEDDVRFESDTVERIQESLSILPDDWELFYIGYCYNNRCPKEEKICKIKNALCTHGIMYRSKAVVDRVLKEINQTEANYIDWQLSWIMESGLGKGYLFNPYQLVQQNRNDFGSDIPTSGLVHDSPMIQPVERSEERV